LFSLGNSIEQFFHDVVGEVALSHPKHP
jgi:hypothetical protein